MRLLSALLFSAGVLALGCSPTPAPPAPTAARTDDHDHDHGHRHDRAKMKEAHAGKYHVWLTAHLSAKDGNELDMFFEGGTHDDPKPAPIPVEKIVARAVRVGEEKEYELEFVPAPAEERPHDPPGACSHFVAKAPWMTADDTLTVVADIELDGKPRRPRWAKFVVKDNAHHIDP
jgi:hypothetical protein